MKPQDLTVDANGRPLVTLMTDPDGGAAYLSVVKQGANGRRFRVTKADGSAAGDENGPVNQVGPFLGVRGLGLFSRLFAPLLAMFGSSESVAKSGAGPTEFNAALAAPKLNDLLWQSGDALRDVLRNILADTEIADKGAAYAAALDQHRAYLLGELAKVPVAKSAEVAALLVPVEKAGKILSARNATAVRAARDALTALLVDAGVEEAGGVASTQVAKEANVLDLVTVQKAAQLAGETAIAVAKAANPQIAPADLVRIGTEASNGVMKAAVAGPAQPAMPTGELMRQIAEAGAGSGSPTNPTDAFTAAIGGLRADVMKAVEGVTALTAKVAALDAELNGGADAATPGLRTVVEKTLVAVRKAARVPEPPKGGDGAGAGGAAGGQGGAGAGAGAADDFEGSALSFK